MKRVSLRWIAADLGVSAATVSRVYHGDPRVAPATAARVREALERHEYRLDPVVSAGLSRVRRRQFYRETLAWCGDTPAEKMSWLAPLFRSIEESGAQLGYKLEYYHFPGASRRDLARLAAIWRARGIRGVLLGPFQQEYMELPMPWEDFSWVTIGHQLQQPLLHTVGRDYAADIRAGLDWLKIRGAQRPCFLVEPSVRHIFRDAMLSSALMHYYDCADAPPDPYLEFEAEASARFHAWLDANRPDSLVLTRIPRPPALGLLRSLFTLPTVMLSPPHAAHWSHLMHFTVRYESIGRSAVNLLHQHLGMLEVGVPSYRQILNVNSSLAVGAVAAG